MKKLFCKLPPLQWAAFLSALISAALQTAAMLLEFETESNYFAVGATLPKIAILFALLSCVLGILSAIFTAKEKKLLATYPTGLRRLHIAPAVGFLFALIGLGWDLFQKASDLWEQRNDGATFLRDFLAGKTKLALFALLLLFCALFYCLSWALSKKENQTETVLLGFATVIACALLSAYLYFDFSIEMNTPVKSLLQGGCLCSMILFTTELRLPLEKAFPKLLLAVSNLVISITSLTAVSVPVAFFTGKLQSTRVDHLFYSLFLLCMIPAALEHIITSSHSDNQANTADIPDSNDPDTERTES